MANAAQTSVGSPAKRPRPASSRNVAGLTDATAWIQPVQQVERDVDGREEERQEDRHLHERPGLERAEAHGDARMPRARRPR